jgi:hypothetical protein
MVIVHNAKSHLKELIGIKIKLFFIGTKWLGLLTEKNKIKDEV